MRAVKAVQSDPACPMRAAPRPGAAVPAALVRRRLIGVRESSVLNRTVTGDSHGRLWRYPWGALQWDDSSAPT